jgi:hypothetical protein
MRRWIWLALAIALATAGAVIGLSLRQPWESQKPGLAGNRTVRFDAGNPPLAEPSVAHDDTEVQDDEDEDSSPDNSGSPDDRPPSWNANDPTSIATYQDYFGRNARADAENIVPIIFEDTARDLHLSAEKNEALFALLIEYNGQLNYASHAPDKDRMTVAREIDEIRAKREADLARLLGPEGLAAMKRYWLTVDARYEVSEVDTHLANYRSLMTKAQRRRMVDATTKPGVLLPDREFSLSESAAAVRQEVTARVEQNDQRLLSAAKPILDAGQFTIYEEFLAERRPDKIMTETPFFARVPASE